jgi:hypothetical protein
MPITKMPREECIALLSRARFAHLACACDGKPYVVPLFFAYDDSYLYCFSTIGRKIDWLRKNPHTCVEVDEIDSGERWACVVVAGCFEELTDTPELQDARADAYRLLKDHASWWVPAYSRTDDQETRPLDPIYFRISIDEITGRRTVPP